jgi:DNA mismatch repair protein MutS2
MGRERISRIVFSTDQPRIAMLLGETREFLTILKSGLLFPSQDYIDLSPVLHRILTPGSWILTEELIELRISLKTIAEIIHFFNLPAANQFKNLKALAGDLEVPSFLLREIDRIMDEKGMIRDSASESLARMRKEIRSKATASEKIINQLLQSARGSGWVADGAEITLSDGRLVLPVLATHKRKIRGIIHDESATGHTVYLEPEACLEINNEIRELESAEKREIIKILTQFTDLLRPEAEGLFMAYDFLGEIDFIRAKALLASDLGGTRPVVQPYPALRWRSATHPLLLLSHRMKGRSVVPLDLTLDEDNRILVITGPNAGGKSVCLKTVGLLQYMLQCGFLVPMDPDSECGIFDHIFIDIGDEQSLENDLSTYSSHLLNLGLFIRNCDSRSLFLVDELGTGTDPSLGGALAEAALEKLSETKAYGVVTTHYSNLKVLAGKVPGIMNGAMLFDTDLLQPLYKLATGKPGSSFTFEIAGRIGFPEEVIELAKSKTGRTHLDFERQLHELETEKMALEKQLMEFKVADQFLSELIEKYETARADLETTRRGILEKAREDARELLDSSNRIIEKTIREIRESAAEKEKTRQTREDLSKFKEKIEQPKPVQTAKNVPAQKVQTARWKKGDRVSVEGRKGTGIIQQIKGTSATVDFDGFKLSIAMDKLQVVKAYDTRPSGPYSSIIRDLNEKAVKFKLQLDVRGKMADEALQQVQKYLDDAYLLRIKEVSILHGKGEGILRKVIRDLLAQSDEVESFGDEQIEYGGAGITKVKLK